MAWVWVLATVAEVRAGGAGVAATVISRLPAGTAVAVDSSVRAEEEVLIDVALVDEVLLV